MATLPVLQEEPQSPVKKRTAAATTSDAILGFVPAIVVQSFIDSKKKGLIRTLPQKQSFRSIVMFADISGFTMLTETLSKIGPEGAEVIAFSLNRYMELLVKEIMRCGGDILKFAGDAMIIVWPPPNTDNQREYNIELETYLRQAIQTCLDIQAKLNDTFILENIKLSVKCGFGIGDISIIYVGGEFNRSEYLATGDPLTQAFECEHHATSGGQSIICRQIYELVGKYFQCEKITEIGDHHSEHGPFYFVTGIAKNQRKIQITKNPLKIIKDNLSHAIFEQIKPEMMNYIPAALLPYVQIDQERWSAELRRVTIMFVNLGIDLTDAKTQEGLMQIQKVIRTVQKCVYKFQGSLNKLLMDDKGSTLIVVFGLPPMAHQDDPVRALATAATMRHELGLINCKCNIGIGTGMVFAGVVGTSGSRREYSVLGDSVNLSARLMQAACGDPDKKIIIDEATAQEAVQKIPVRFYKNIKVKGKELDIPIYEPIFVTFELMRQIYDQQGHICFNFLRTHNPAYPQKVSPLKSSYVGKERIQDELKRIVDAYLGQMISKALVEVKGSFGIGKSLSVHVALNQILQKITQGTYKKLKYDEKHQFIGTNIGPFHKDQKYNAIRLVVQQVIMMYCKRHKKEPTEKLVEELIKHDQIPPADWEMFVGMFEFKDRSWIADFPPTKQPESKTMSKSIKSLVLQVLALYLEEIPECLQHLKMKCNNTDPVLSPPPLVLVCDDVQYYDYASFRLLKKITKSFQNILLIMVIRDEFLEPPVFQAPDARTQTQIVMDGLTEIENCFSENSIHDFKISGLKKRGRTDHIHELITKEFGVKEFQLGGKSKNKQRSQTIGQSNNPVKQAQQQLPGTKPKASSDDQKIMGSTFMFQQMKPVLFLHDPNSLMLNFINLKTQGNPLTLMHFFKQLTGSKLLKVELGTAIISQQLEDIIMLEEAFTIDNPIDRVRVNQPLFDKLSCLEIILMKVASVIGDIFDVQTLYKIQPLKDEISYEKILKLLRTLDDKNIIELMEVNDVNIYYRFTCPFMRECIYQTMIFTQRRELHRNVAQAIQELPSEYEVDQEVEAMRLEHHLSLSEQKWSLTNPDAGEQRIVALSHKAKRSMIVKKIQQTLMKHRSNPSTIIIKGFLEKKSDVNVSWAQRYCLMTVKDFRYFYTPDDFKKDPDNPLGIIPLRAIYMILPLNDKEEVNKQNAFQISTSMWIKKQTEMEERKFYFAGLNEEVMEEWTIYLEFSRSMAMYDQFVMNFGKIQFPLGQPSDYYDMNLGYQINNLENKQTILVQRNQEKVIPLHQSTIIRGSRLQSLVPLRKQNSQVLERTNRNDIEMLKERLQQFLQRSLLLVYSHMFEVSMRQHTGQPKQFGHATKAMTKFISVFRIDPHLLNNEKLNMGSSIYMPNSRNLLQPSLSISEEDNGGRRHSNIGKLNTSQLSMLSAIKEDDDEKVMEQLLKRDKQKSKSSNKVPPAERKGSPNKPIQTGSTNKERRSSAMEKSNSKSMAQSHFDSDESPVRSIHLNHHTPPRQFPERFQDVFSDRSEHSNTDRPAKYDPYKLDHSSPNDQVNQQYPPVDSSKKINSGQPSPKWKQQQQPPWMDAQVHQKQPESYKSPQSPLDNSQLSNQASSYKPILYNQYTESPQQSLHTSQRGHEDPVVQIGNPVSQNQTSKPTQPQASTQQYQLHDSYEQVPPTAQIQQQAYNKYQQQPVAVNTTIPEQQKSPMPRKPEQSNNKESSGPRKSAEVEKGQPRINTEHSERQAEQQPKQAEQQRLSFQPDQPKPMLQSYQPKQTMTYTEQPVAKHAALGSAQMPKEQTGEFEYTERSAKKFTPPKIVTNARPDSHTQLVPVQTNQQPPTPQRMQQSQHMQQSQQNQYLQQSQQSQPIQQSQLNQHLLQTQQNQPIQQSQLNQPLQQSQQIQPNNILQSYIIPQPSEPRPPVTERRPSKPLQSTRFHYYESVSDQLLNNLKFNSKKAQIAEHKKAQLRVSSQPPAKKNGTTTTQKMNTSRTPTKTVNHFFEGKQMLALKQSYSVKGQKCVIQKGQRVQINRFIAEQGLYEIEVNSQLGCFPQGDFSSVQMDSSFVERSIVIDRPPMQASTSPFRYR